MYQHRRRSSSGVNDSVVYTHLKATNHTFEDKDVKVLDKEHRWFERGVKEAIYVRREEPSLNRGGGLRTSPQPTKDLRLGSQENSKKSITWQFNPVTGHRAAARRSVGLKMCLSWDTILYSHQNNKCKSRWLDLYHFIIDQNSQNTVLIKQLKYCLAYLTFNAIFFSSLDNFL